MASLAETFARAAHDFRMRDELRPGLHFRACLAQKAGDFVGVVELDDRRILERCIHGVVLGDRFGGQRLGGHARLYHAAPTVPVPLPALRACAARLGPPGKVQGGFRIHAAAGRQG